MSKKIRGALLAALCGAAAFLFLFWLPNLFFPIPPPDPNAEYLAWFAGRAGPSFTERAGRPGEVCTNPLLSRLDNGEVCFDKKKKPGALRIFCVGGSTTRGWPFHRTGAYPEMLAAYLRRSFPGRETEVINAGFMVSDTVTDLPLMEELAAYAPDIFLVYEGRNDAINSASHGAAARLARDAHLWLDGRLYAYGALRRLVLGAGMNNALGFRLACRLASWRGEDRRKREFTANILKMRAAAEAAGARAVFLTQAAYPPEKIERPDPDRAQRAALALSSGRPRDLAVRLEEETLLANDWLEQAAAAEGLELLRIDKAFGSAGAERLLIAPPLTHPNREGYCLMAGAAGRYLAETTPALRGGAAAGDFCGSLPPPGPEPYTRVSETFKLLGYGGYAALYASKAGR